jgi:hypothetical protein
VLKAREVFMWLLRDEHRRGSRHGDGVDIELGFDRR